MAAAQADDVAALGKAIMSMVMLETNLSQDSSFHDDIRHLRVMPPLNYD